MKCKNIPPQKKKKKLANNTTLIPILKTCLKQKLLNLQVKNLTKISLFTYT